MTPGERCAAIERCITQLVREANRAWQQQIPDSKLIVMPGNSYHVAVSDAEACAKAALEFIESRG